MTEKGFRALFEAHFEDIRRYLFFRSGDAELSTDVAQETFLRVWEKKLDLKPGSDVALLYKMAGNFLTSHYRRERTERRVHTEMQLELRVEMQPELQGDDPEHDIHYKELRDRYKKALMKLPEKQRVVFMMSRMEQFSYREISERLDISVKAVEKRMNRALNYLRTELEVE